MPHWRPWTCWSFSFFFSFWVIGISDHKGLKQLKIGAQASEGSQVLFLRRTYECVSPMVTLGTVSRHWNFGSSVIIQKLWENTSCGICPSGFWWNKHLLNLGKFVISFENISFEMYLDFSAKLFCPCWQHHDVLLGTETPCRSSPFFSPVCHQQEGQHLLTARRVSPTGLSLETTLMPLC